VAHLEGAQHVAGREPEKGMGVTVPLDVAELARETRPRRITEVEDERLPRPEAVGKELPVGGELVLGVVRSVPESRDRQGGDDAAIPHRILRDVQHRQEVRGRRVG
jgi:hypothetical protein